MRRGPGLLKERLMSDLLSFLAGAVLVFSALLYLVFVSRILAKAGGPNDFCSRVASSACCDRSAS